jgi:hypothetical protein
MKAKLLLFATLSGSSLTAQTITYAGFSQSLTDTLPVNIAANGSFSSSLTTTTGNGVTWDASSLSLQPGPPTVHLLYGSPSSTPNGSLFPASNYVQYDPALTAVLEYNYYSFVADSITKWGNYAPNGSHEIYQNPDKSLIFPFAYGQSFTDSYAKTNYSDATTISSFQTGTRTVTFCGFGTLILPQGYFYNVAMVSEVRTNSLGPDAYYYTWYDINDGRKLLFRSENNGSITTAWCADPPSPVGLKETKQPAVVKIFPNPMTETVTIKWSSAEKPENLTLKLYNLMGQELRTVSVTGNEASLNRSGLGSGLYFYLLISNEKLIAQGNLVIE